MTTVVSIVVQDCLCLVVSNAIVQCPRNVSDKDLKAARLTYKHTETNILYRRVKCISFFKQCTCLLLCREM